MPVRLTVALLALAAGAAAVVVVALVLRSTPGPVPSVPSAPTAASSPPPAQHGFPAPPAHAIVFAREDGANVLALAVTASSAQVSVVGQQGTGVDGLAVSVNGAPATSCGAGCYRAAVAHARAVDVRVGSTRWHVDVPAARDASALVARSGAVWRSLDSLAFSDRLGSDATHVVFSNWRVVAPDRLAYDVRGGDSAVLVGGRRWDRAPGGRWIESPQSVPVKQPVPVWQSATDANVVGQTPTTWRITFYDPGTPAWFAIVLDRRTLRTVDLRMITTAHFMHERYRAFDAPLVVKPPG